MEMDHNSRPELSIVVPAYNASKTLGKVLDTLLDQTVDHNRYRIILVNDGSTDTTLQICVSYASKYSNISVLNQENQGVSGARNAGIEAAVGRWITFVDSDDFVDTHYVETMLCTSPEESFVIFDTLRPKGKGLIREKAWMQPYVDQKQRMMDVLVWICDNRLNAPYDKRFSLEIIRKKDIRFLRNVGMAEDLLFNFQYALCVETAFVSGSAVYVHTDNPDGICRKKVTENRLREYEAVFRIMQNGCLQRNLDIKYSRIIRLAFLRMIVRYAGQLCESGYQNKSIAAYLHESEMVRELLNEPAASYKDWIRKCLLRKHMYSVCAMLFKYR